MTSGQGPAAAGEMWTADIVVTAEFATDLIKEQFPDLSIGQISELETGWDNTAFVVDGQWLFRFPRREIAVPGVWREITVLPRLAPLLPLPIPDPQFIGQPSARYPWPFFGARLLPGTELAESRLSESGRRAAGAAVGNFLRVLHDPGLVPLVDGAGLPVDPMRRASPPVRARRARDVLDRLVERGIWPAVSEVHRLLDRAEAEPEESAPEHSAPGDSALVVCQGDFHLRHLLVDSDGAAAGVIDWGDLCLADPAVDLSIAYLGFSGQARADLLSAYGRPVTARRELAARACAISIGVSLAEYAAEENRSALLDESLAGLHRSVAD